MSVNIEQNKREIAAKKTEAWRINKVVGERARKARIANGLSIDAAAALIGISKGKLSKLENAIQMTPLPLILRLSAAYNVTVDYLLGRSSSMEGDPINSAVTGALRATEQLLRRELGGVTKSLFRLSVEKAENKPVFDAVLSSAESLLSAMDRWMKVKMDDPLEFGASLLDDYGSQVTHLDVFNELPKGSSVLNALENMRTVVTKLRENKERHDRIRRIQADDEYVAAAGGIKSQIGMMFEMLDEEWKDDAVELDQLEISL